MGEWRLTGVIAAAVGFSLLAVVLPSSEAAAHGRDHPTALRNARNQFTFLKPQKLAPMTPILAEDGGLFHLGRFRGRVVLLNFWATWCPPCIRELPALQRLQSALGGPDFTVVALSIDDADIEVPVAFVRRLGLADLGVYLDFTGATAKAFPLYGLPITYLIDRTGAMIGYIIGAVEWDSPAAIGFLRHYIE